MKRSPELRDLSVEHHHGLVAARQLRWAAQGKIPLELAVTQFLERWREAIQPHFRLEEEVLLPGYARAVPADHDLIVRTLTEHVALRRAVRALGQAHGEDRLRLAAEIGQGLDDHIRFEERVLFPAMEAALEGEGLAAVGRELREAG